MLGLKARTSEDPISVIVVNSEELVASAFAALCEKVDDVKVVGWECDGWKALRVIEMLLPDIALVDISMPGLNGIDFATHLRQRASRTKVILFTQYSDDIFFRRAIQAGAHGYLWKGSSFDEFRMAIQSVAKGKPYISQQLTQTLLTVRHRGTVSDALSMREQQVLKLTAEGRSIKEIANLLNISMKTVESHRANIKARLGLRTLSSLVRYSLKCGLIRD